MSEYMLGPPILFYISRQGGKKYLSAKTASILKGE